MRLATLIVNPAAGRAHLLARQLPAIVDALSRKGFATRVVYTSAEADSMRALAAEAARDSEWVLAAGGDGTVHGVVQALTHTAVALGVLPLGTANALARNLGLPLDPLAATHKLLECTPRRIPVGEIVTATTTRFFVVMAGCGPDGALVRLLSQTGAARLKARYGRPAYYGHAARLFFTRQWPPFHVHVRESPCGPWSSLKAIAVMSSRVSDLGGLFTGLTPQASLTRDRLRVQLVLPPAPLSLPAWRLCAWLALPNPWLHTIEASELRCTPLARFSIYTQADAEPCGELPMTLRLLPAALTLLMPPQSFS